MAGNFLSNVGLVSQGMRSSAMDTEALVQQQQAQDQAHILHHGNMILTNQKLLLIHQMMILILVL